MTKRQHEILTRFRRLAEEKGHRPTLSELAQEFCVSVPTMHGIFIKLRDEGFLVSDGHGAWSLTDRCRCCGQKLP